MSIEQTNQLILLILNSVLMTLLSSLLLGGAWLRQNALLRQLNQTRAHYRKITRSPAIALATEQALHPSANIQATELKYVRDRRAHINEQYQWSRIGTLVLHATLLIFSVSLFALALRALLAFDSLISTALFLFTVGAASLLIGIGCILVDFAKGNTDDDSLGQALSKTLRQLGQQWKLISSFRPNFSSTKDRAVQSNSSQRRTDAVHSSIASGQTTSQQISS